MDLEQEEVWWGPLGLMLILAAKSIGSMLPAYSAGAPTCSKQNTVALYAFAIVPIKPHSM